MIEEKNWDKSEEKSIMDKWISYGIFSFDAKTNKPVFSIDTPPPYVNTPIHIGHAATYTMMDMFARYRRMRGFEVLFPLGLDRNGLPIEVAAEKKFKVRLSEVTREQFIEMCNKVLEESSNESIDSFMKLGISFNSWNKGSEIGDVYYTDSKEFRALTQATFIDLWHKGLVYKDKRINNYCPGCRTTIADAEIDYKEINTDFVEIKFKVKETGQIIHIGTTRPELIPSCGMVIFNPIDDRYKHLEGMTAITPLFEKEVPIKSHTFADPEKGTGLVMMCSAGDQTDIRFFREMNIMPVISIGINGKMNENAGILEGLSVSAARKKMKEVLEEKNLTVSVRTILHRIPICERSKDSIEFIEMEEYYLKQVEFKGDLKKIADEMNFYSEKSKQILIDWIDSVSIDWPISRRRYYATEIPLWYCNNCNKVFVPEKGKYYQPWKEKPGAKCECGNNDFTGEERVFDTWFDSSNTPLYILKYGSSFFDNMPCTLRPQGKEIVRTWFYYTLLKIYLLTKQKAFKDAWIHHHITDDAGKKMSKSVGNIIDPHEILEKFGAEPFRLWCAIEGDLTKGDLKCSFDRIQGAGKTLTKLWNVSRFISNFGEAEKPNKLCETDKWIINELNKIIESAEKSYEEYDFHTPSLELKHFLWETFASHYLEIVKSRAYNEIKEFSEDEHRSAVYTLNYCLDIMLKLLYPLIPFITYKIYKTLRDKEITGEEFPKTEKIKETTFETKDIEELNKMIWKTKKDAGLSLKDPVKEAVIPYRLEPIEKDLIFAHKINKISYGDETSLIL